LNPKKGGRIGAHNVRWKVVWNRERWGYVISILVSQVVPLL